MESARQSDWNGRDRRVNKVVDAQWQALVEEEKAALARTLHDHTGAMLAAARMDISWSVKCLGTQRHEVTDRLERARRALDEAIDFNRKLVEQLHPTLLDDFGLPAALRMRISQLCIAAKIPCAVTYAEPGLSFAPLPAIVLFRIAQSIVEMLISRRSSAITIHLAEENGWIVLSLDGAGLSASCGLDEAAHSDLIASVKSRALAFGGDLFSHFDEDTIILSCRLPARVALAAAEKVNLNHPL